MAYIFNMFHWDEGMDSTALATDFDSRYLMLDQTTPQTVDSGTPNFNSGIYIERDNNIPLISRFVSNSITNIEVVSLYLQATTTQNMADGFGTAASFYIKDATSNMNWIGGLGFIRNGSDTIGKFVLSLADSISGYIEPFTLTESTADFTNLNITTTGDISGATVTGAVNGTVVVGGHFENGIIGSSVDLGTDTYAINATGSSYFSTTIGIGDLTAPSALLGAALGSVSATLVDGGVTAITGSDGTNSVGIADGTYAVNATGNSLFTGNVTSTTTVQGEQVTSTDDMTLSGKLLDTLAADDTTAFQVDGTTNPTVTPSTHNLFSIARTFNSNSATAMVPTGMNFTLTNTSIMSGTASTSPSTVGMQFTMTTSGAHTVVPAKSPPSEGNTAFSCNVTRSGTLAWKSGGTVSVTGLSLTGSIQDNMNIAAGTMTSNLYGFFANLTNACPLETAGTHTTNAYGSSVTITGTQAPAGTSTGIGSYLKASGSDNNIGLQVNVPASVGNLYGIWLDTDNGTGGGAIWFGAFKDANIGFDGNSLNIVSNAVTATDGIELTAGTNGISFIIGATSQVTVKDGAMSPVTTNDIDLGTSSLLFKILYLEGNAIIDSDTAGLQLGEDQDILISSDANGVINIASANPTTTDITINFGIGASTVGVMYWMEDEDYFKFADDILIDTNQALYLRDTAISVSSNDDGHLDLNADTSIDLNAKTLVDHIGELNASHGTTFDNKMTLGGSSTDTLTCVGRLIPRSVASDPTANATAGSRGEIVFYNDNWYGKTTGDGTDTNWVQINQVPA